MTITYTSHVSQLLYKVAPVCNFAQLVGDVRDAFTADANAVAALTWDCDDIALLDFNSARVVIGFSDNLPGTHAACFTVAVGQAPIENVVELHTADHALLCKSIIARLERRFPCDGHRSQVLGQALTADLIDRVVDEVFAQDDPNIHPKTAQRPAAAAPEPTLAITNSEPGDLDRLLQRLSTELTARTPSLISRAIASVSPRSRGAASGDEGSAGNFVSKPEASAIATLRGSGTANLARGLFRFKTKVANTGSDATTEQTGARLPHRAPSSELKAVRDALYAQDASTVSFGGIVAQSKQRLQLLAALPAEIANAVVDLRRGDAMRTENKVRH